MTRKWACFGMLVAIGMVGLWTGGATVSAAESAVEQEGPIIPTSGVFAFESRQWGLSMNYPTDWEKRERYGRDGGGTAMFVSPLGPGEDPETTPQATIGIIVIPLEPGERSAQAFSEKFFERSRQRSPGLTMLSESQITVGGLPAYEALFTNQVGSPGEQVTLKQWAVCMVKDAYGYVWYYNHEQSQFDKLIDVGRRLLASLSLNYHHQDDGETWIYENRMYGIRFHYPKSWRQAVANPDQGVVARFFFSTDGLPSDQERGSQENLSVGVLRDSRTTEIFKQQFVKGTFSRSKHFRVDEVQSVILAGHPGYRVMFSYEEEQGVGVREVVVFTIIEGTRYGLYYFPIDDERLPVIQQAIDSFEIFEASS